jgi:hypothetical protein
MTKSRKSGDVLSQLAGGPRTNSASADFDLHRSSNLLSPGRCESSSYPELRYGGLGRIPVGNAFGFRDTWADDGHNLHSPGSSHTWSHVLSEGTKSVPIRECRLTHFDEFLIYLSKRGRLAVHLGRPLGTYRSIQSKSGVSPNRTGIKIKPE